MYQGRRRSSSRDGGGYDRDRDRDRVRDRDRDRRSRSPYARRPDDRDGDYRRSRKGIYL